MLPASRGDPRPSQRFKCSPLSLAPLSPHLTLQALAAQLQALEEGSGAEAGPAQLSAVDTPLGCTSALQAVTLGGRH